jgi:hypothetical protein
MSFLNLVCNIEAVELVVLKVSVTNSTTTWLENRTHIIPRVSPGVIQIQPLCG